MLRFYRKMQRKSWRIPEKPKVLTSKLLSKVCGLYLKSIDDFCISTGNLKFALKLERKYLHDCKKLGKVMLFLFHFWKNFGKVAQCFLVDCWSRKCPTALSYYASHLAGNFALTESFGSKILELLSVTTVESFSFLDFCVACTSHPKLPGVSLHSFYRISWWWLWKDSIAWSCTRYSQLQKTAWKGFFDLCWNSCPGFMRPKICTIIGVFQIVSSFFKYLIWKCDRFFSPSSLQ